MGRKIILVMLVCPANNNRKRQRKGSKIGVKLDLLSVQDKI